MRTMHLHGLWKPRRRFQRRTHMRLSIIIAVLVVAAARTGAAQQADSTTAYLDNEARALVRLARERRQIADVSVHSYKALSKERMSVGLRGIRRDRLLYRREVAGRIEWTRDSIGKIEILGAREAIPVAIKGLQVPDDLGSFMPHLAFDPADNRMLLDWGDNEFIRHPLAPNSERFYKFRTGTTTTIQLPDGKIVRLIELEIVPRTSDPHNINGSFWLEAESHAVVRAAFKLARTIDLTRDVEKEEDQDHGLPGFVKPLIANLDYITIDYSFYDLKWWLPHSFLAEGFVRAGMIRVPMQYERSYTYSDVKGSDARQIRPIAEIVRADSLRRSETDSCERRMRINVNVGTGARPAGVRTHATETTQCGRWVIVTPTDSATLLNSPELPPNAFATGEQLISEGELRDLGQRIEKLGGGPSILPQPVTDFGLLKAPRYNRIEGLSVAVKGDVDFGAFRTFGSARIGFADLKPNFELGVERPGENVTLTLGAYKRLNPMDPTARPFSLGASLSSLLWGRDEADYYRALGAELKAEPTGGSARWYTVRLFAQRESPATRETQASLRHLLNSSYVFRENIIAVRENEMGGELNLHFNHGLNPDGVRFGADLYSHAATGTNDFGRSALTLRTGFPLPGAFSGALEASGGATSSGAPIQHQWFLGGPASLRGYNVATLIGETFWRGRAEIGYGLPAVRIVGFADAGWAGDRHEFKKSKPLLSAGGGVSMLDGILRFDVARALKTPKGWAAYLYFDAAI
jgi:hypothetical protein